MGKNFFSPLKIPALDIPPENPNPVRAWKKIFGEIKKVVFWSPKTPQFF